MCKFVCCNLLCHKLDFEQVEPSGAVAKGKGKKGASQLTTDMNLKSEARKIPTMEEATITLQDAEVTRSSALAIFDKTTAMRKIESRPRHCVETCGRRRAPPEEGALYHRVVTSNELDLKTMT